MPESPLPGSKRNLWYGWDHGPIHFTFMSSEHNFLEGSEQWHFLRKDLAAVDRKRTPWLVFAGHRPMYSSSATQETSQMGAHLRQAIEPLLAEFKVDIALWGHVHK